MTTSVYCCKSVKVIYLFSERKKHMHNIHKKDRDIYDIAG